MTASLKTVSVIAVSLMVCVVSQTQSRAATDQAQDNNTQCNNSAGYLHDNASETLSETLVISTPDTNWARKNHSLMTLTKGSLIVIAGKQPVVIKTAAGEADVPAGLAAMVQQESSSPVRISMIGVRGKVASPNRSNWIVTVTAADHSVYKLGFGDVLLSALGDNNNTVVFQEPPAARKVMREAAHQLNFIIQILDVNGVLLADKIANDCTGTLLSLTQGSIVPTVEQFKHPVNIFIDDGTKFVAIQPNSVYRSTVTALVAARKK